MAESITIPKWFTTLIVVAVPVLGVLYGWYKADVAATSTRIEVVEDAVESVEVEQAVIGVKLDFIVDGVSALADEHAAEPPSRPNPEDYLNAAEDAKMIQSVRKE